MNAPAGGAARADSAPLARAALLLAGLGLAAVLRTLVAGSAGGTSVGGDVAFASGALGVAAAAGKRLHWPGPARLAARVGVGLAGALLLVAVPVARRLGGGPHPALVIIPGWHGLGTFALATAVVAGADEVVLRGALWDALTEALGARGEWLALTLGAVAFALLHVPWYGWGVVPLDLAVGAWLGALRMATGGVAAPLTAHAGADLATWGLL